MGEVALRDAGQWFSGGTPSTANPAYWSGDIPWITARSLKSSVLTTSERTLTEQGVAAGSRLVPAGTLLFVVRGMSLNTEFRVGIAGRELAFGQDCKALIPRGDIFPKYLLHALDALEPEVLKRVEQASHGTGRLPTDALGRLTVRVPPLEEQRRIAEILDTVEDAICSTRRLITKLLTSQQAVVTDLLGESLSGSRRRIGEFAQVRRGASPRPIDDSRWFSSEGPGWVRIGDVTRSGERLIKTEQRLSDEGARRSRRIAPGDVIMSIAATIGEAIVSGIDACIHDGFVHVDHDDSVLPEFMVLLLRHHRRDFVAQGQTGTQPNVNSSIVAATEVVLPDMPTQRRILRAKDTFRDQILAAERTLGAYHYLRTGLREDLLSGRVRMVVS